MASGNRFGVCDQNFSDFSWSEKKQRSGGDEEESDLTEEGYDCKFVKPGPADDHSCPICQLVVRNAYQVNCCGKIFCRNCLFRHKNLSPYFICPCCREYLGNKFFQDTRSNREIQSLKVYCPHKSAGCVWTGELKLMDGHSKECSYQNVHCVKCNRQMLKRDLQDHESNECPMRVYKCPLCGEEGTYESITGEHKLKNCPKVVLPCKNPGCNEKVERCKMPLHRQSCPMEVVNCPYHDIGCTHSAERGIMEKHIEANTELHLSKAVKRVREMQPKAVCPTVIKFSGYSRYKVLEKRWFSPGVYTCDGGYKFRLSVYPNGIGYGKGSHVSVYINVMPGEYDDTLGWPLRATFIIHILNQLGDDNHHTKYIIFKDDTPGRSAYRKKEEDEKGGGVHSFVAQSSLELNVEKHYQYLKDDTIYFKVEVNLFSTTKPWLTNHCV